MSALKRFRLEEVSPRRIYEAVQRRLVDLPDALAWRLPSQFSLLNKSRLSTFRDRHTGKRCFIMGNGPSLASMDLSPLKDEFTFGLNRIYLNFEKMGFMTSFLVSINELVLEQFHQEIAALPTPKFLNWNRRALFSPLDESCAFLKMKYSLADTFSQDLLTPISGGATVTYAALQIAFYMGFEQVILIGVDHNFTSSGTPNTTETRRPDEDRDHFHPNYFPKGVRWQLPDLRRSELAFAIADRTYTAAGRRVLDATVGGKCPVFKKVDYNTLFLSP